MHWLSTCQAVYLLAIAGISLLPEAAALLERMIRVAAWLCALVAVIAGVLSQFAERSIEVVELGNGGYDITPVVAPVASGTLIKLLSAVICSDWLGPIISRLLLNGNDMHLVRQLGAASSEPAVHMPLVRLDANAYESHRTAAQKDEIPSLDSHPGHELRGVLDFHRDYKSKVSTPVEETKRALNAAKSVGEKLHCFVEIFEESATNEAARSAERWAKGEHLGLFDGVPFVVKDEIAVAGTVIGDGFVRPGREYQQSDDLVVARLRAAGGVLIGKTVMTTIGIDPLGYNPDFQGPLNAYNRSHYPGGSSSGTATAVAAGVVPVGIGLDGGGSIRLPAAFSGVFGLAPTFGRVPFSNSEAAAMSVIKIGPIAIDSASLAVVYRIIAQVEISHQYSSLYGGVGPPPPHLAGFNQVASLAGIRLGVFKAHFEDASGSMVAGCNQALEILKRLGATVVEVNIPHMKALALAHGLTIGSEMGSLHDVDWWQHRKHFMPDSKISLGLFRAFSAKEYVAAMRLRGWAMRWMRDHVFSKVDVYVSPAAGTTAPSLSENAKPYGESDTSRVMKVMKFIFLANLLGNPGISLPVAYEEETSLPISLHFMADHWAESVLLRMSNALEAHVKRRRPSTFVT